MKFCYCGQPVWGKGFCKSHQYKRPDFDGRSIIQKAIYKNKAKVIGSKLSSQRIGATGLESIISLENFFKDAAKEIAKNPYCIECGTFIPEKIKIIGKNYSMDGYRCATAHVLPKKKEYGFPSVAANSINRLFLGAGCGCHNKYDSSWDNASKMKVFPLAIEKFIMLYPLIDEKEHKNIPNVFLREI